MRSSLVPSIILSFALLFFVGSISGSPALASDDRTKPNDTTPTMKTAPKKAESSLTEKRTNAPRTRRATGEAS